MTSRAPGRRALRAGLAALIVVAGMSGLGGLTGIATTAPLAADDGALPGLGGGRLAASDLADGTTILVFWASWSPRSRDIVPRVNALAAAWSGRARVATVVFLEKPAPVRAFLADKNLRVPVYLDTAGTFSKEHAITDLPGLLIVRNGKDLFRGKLPADPEPLLRRHLG